jgi:uncharacterized protein (DUF427 family)
MRPRPAARPATPIVPGPGQESDWDFPRPPRVEPSTEHVVIRFGGQVMADSRDAVKVLETSQPPGYYLPRAAFAEGVHTEAPGSSVCEFKGIGRYLDVCVGDAVARRAAWHDAEPWPGYEQIRERVALHPGAMDSCEANGEHVIPQEGGFYGGWITSRVVGPFKGGPGTLGW